MLQKVHIMQKTTLVWLGVVMLVLMCPSDWKRLKSTEKPKLVLHDLRRVSFFLSYKIK